MSAMPDPTDRPEEPEPGKDARESPYLPEDETFPEGFRKIMRVLFAPWNRR